MIFLLKASVIIKWPADAFLFCRWHHSSQFPSGATNGYSHSHSHLHGNRGQRFPPPPPPLPQPIGCGSYHHRGTGTKTSPLPGFTTLYPSNCSATPTSTATGQQDCSSVSIMGSVMGAGVSFMAKRPSLQDTLPEVSASHNFWSVGFHSVSLLLEWNEIVITVGKYAKNCSLCRVWWYNS